MFRSRVVASRVSIRSHLSGGSRGMSVGTRLGVGEISFEFGVVGGGLGQRPLLGLNVLAELFLFGNEIGLGSFRSGQAITERVYFGRLSAELRRQRIVAPAQLLDLVVSQLEVVLQLSKLSGIIVHVGGGVDRALQLLDMLAKLLVLLQFEIELRLHLRQLGVDGFELFEDAVMFGL
jgi:hypothetical protein